jgi:dihydroxy-acid dehydratase
MIEIDLEKKLLDLKVSPAELEQRKKDIHRPERKLTGVLAAYRAGVSGAEEGAMWLYRREW